MSVESVTTLVEALRHYQLLEPAQLDELAHDLEQRLPDARDLAEELIDRGWLTLYQANRLAQGRGQELRFGQYLVLDRISKSAIGPMFRARHQHMKRVVAIQLVNDQWLDHPDAVARFHEDIRAASQLKHPNIVHVYDVGQIGRAHYFVLEHVEGLDLDRMVRQIGPLPIERACAFMRQVALGLQHAHERGLRHHDLKPSNVLVTRRAAGRSGIVKSKDFDDASAVSGSFRGTSIKIKELGLKSLHQHAPETSGSHNADDVEAVVTADCLAPEQNPAAPRPSIRSNLYSLGCIFYYLLTGRPPFPGGMAREKHARHVEEVLVPVEQLRDETPPDVAAVVRRLLAKRPEERFATAAETADALAALMGLGGGSAIYDYDTNTPTGSTDAMLPPVTANEPETMVCPTIGRTIAEITPPVDADDVVARYKQRLEAKKRRLTKQLLMGGGVILATTLAAVILTIFLLRNSTPQHAEQSNTVQAPATQKWTYVKKTTREETILATLRANHMPTFEGKWRYIGPFANPEGKGFDTAYPPETEIDLTKTYPGKDGQVAAWKELTDFAPNRVIDLKRFGTSDWTCVYLYYEIDLTEDMVQPAFFGSDDTLTIWCNGQQVWANNVVRTAGPNQDLVRLNLKEGKNRLLFKICNTTADWAFYAMPLFPPAADEALGNRLLRDF
jgi:serine/threonine-protein kinase